MAAGKIPSWVNGQPLAVADVAPKVSRNAQQRTVAVGDTVIVVISHGALKGTFTLTFPVWEDKQTFIEQSGALLSNPPKHNLLIKLGTTKIAFTRGIVTSVNPTSNQDGDASLQCEAMYEEVAVVP